MIMCIMFSNGNDANRDYNLITGKRNRNLYFAIILRKVSIITGRK